MKLMHTTLHADTPRLRTTPATVQALRDRMTQQAPESVCISAPYATHPGLTAPAEAAARVTVHYPQMEAFTLYTLTPEAARAFAAQIMQAAGPARYLDRLTPAPATPEAPGPDGWRREQWRGNTAMNATQHTTTLEFKCGTRRRVRLIEDEPTRNTWTMTVEHEWSGSVQGDNAEAAKAAATAYAHSHTL